MTSSGGGTRSGEPGGVRRMEGQAARYGHAVKIDAKTQMVEFPKAALKNKGTAGP